MMLYLGSTATAGQVQVLENLIRKNIVPVLNLFFSGAGCEGDDKDGDERGVTGGRRKG